MEEQIINLIVTQNETLSKIVDMLAYIIILLVFIGGYCLFDAVRYQILKKVS